MGRTLNLSIDYWIGEADQGLRERTTRKRELRKKENVGERERARNTNKGEDSNQGHDRGLECGSICCSAAQR